MTQAEGTAPAGAAGEMASPSYAGYGLSSAGQLRLEARLKAAAAPIPENARRDFAVAEPTERLFLEVIRDGPLLKDRPGLLDLVAKRVLPRLRAGHGPPARVWVPGCRTGEDAYAVALLLRQAWPLARAPAQVFATDHDPQAIGRARSALFTERPLPKEMPGTPRASFKPGMWRVDRRVRELCTFATHNLCRDAPFSRLDLILAHALNDSSPAFLQGRLLPLFAYALRPGGLLLVRPELVHLVPAHLFEPLADGAGLFARCARPSSHLAATLIRGPDAMLVWQDGTPDQPRRHHRTEAVAALHEGETQTRELASLNDRLQSANAELESAKDELEARNEELTSLTQALEEKSAAVRAARDALKRTNQRQRRLLADVTSHGRSHLANIRLILSHGAEDAADKQAFIDLLQTRIAALGLTHTAMAQSGFLGIDLHQLALDSLLVFGLVDGGQVSVSGPPVLLASQPAELLGLALHELLLNAVSHGALTTSNGRIALGWAVERMDGVAWLTLTWRESGVPLVNLAPRQGFGRKLIEERIADNLGGQGRFEFSSGGVGCTIRIPLGPSG